VGEPAEQAQLAFAVGAVDGKRSDDVPHPAVDVERRDREGRLRVERIVDEPRQLARREDERHAAARRRRRRACVVAPTADLLPLRLAVAVQPPRDDPAVVVLEPDRRPRRAEQTGGQLDDAVDDPVEARRGRELAAELEQRCRAFGLAARRFDEAAVLDRDRCVTGDDLEQPHVVLVELVETELGDDDHTCDP
jgi:hypothetical protein